MPPAFHALPQVCLVSEHNLPNLLMMLEGRAPSAILLHTRTSARASRHLERALEHVGTRTRVTHVEIPDTNTVADLRSAMRAVIEPLTTPHCVNLTGGTKAMSLALALVAASCRPHDAAGAHARHLQVYVDLRSTFAGAVEVIVPPDHPAVVLRVHVEMDALLALHGAEVIAYRTTDLDQPSIKLGDTLAKRTKVEARALVQKLQRFVYYNADDRRTSPSLEPLAIPLHVNDDDVAMAVKIGAWSGWWKTTETLVAPSTQMCFGFAGGQWLEEWVAHTLHNAPRVVHDLAIYRSLEFGRLVAMGDEAASATHPFGAPDPHAGAFDPRVRNEIDVAFVRGNHLTLIECKAVNWTSKKSESLQRDALFKLEAVRQRLGGRHHRAVLVTLNPLTEHNMRRAKDSNILVIEFGDVDALHALLTDSFPLRAPSFGACGT